MYATCTCWCLCGYTLHVWVKKKKQNRWVVFDVCEVIRFMYKFKKEKKRRVMFVWVYATCMCIGLVYVEWYNCVLVFGVWYVTLVFLETVEKWKELVLHIKIVPSVLVCVNAWDYPLHLVCAFLLSFGVYWKRTLKNIWRRR